MKEEMVNIKIPKTLYDKIKEEVKKSKGEFKDEEEYITFVLEELLKEEDQEVYSKEEEEEIKKRLKALGYIG